jgi:class I fructose-bisphosphate aldolase
MGVDVVKAPFCGDVESHRQIVSDCPVPLVAAGGPRTATLEGALQLISDVVASGALGATIGRNVWGHARITAVVQAFKAVIHDEASPGEAMRQAGL